MKKVNTGASVKARLLRIAKASGKPYDGMLKLFAMERLAYRLSKSRFKDVLILKGALFFLVMNMPDRRTTLDIDLLARYDNDPFKIAGIVKEICSAAVENDGIIYDTRSITSGRITEAAEYPGVRVKLNAYIEKTRVPLQVDFGFGDAVYPGVKKIKYPVLLDLPAPKIKCYPPESVISEKFESMVRLGDLNSRMKDFYDIWLIFRNLKLKKNEVAKAVKKTFKKRETSLPQAGRLFSEGIYNKDSDRQQLWKGFLTRNNIKNAPGFLSDAAGEIEKQLTGAVKLIRKGKI